MVQKMPQYVIDMMADRAWRMEHFLWHEVRNGWLFFDAPTQNALRGLGWEPPRPARRPGPNRPEVILDNNSGEDFLYMHRQMIGAVNDRLAGDPQYPKIEGWKPIPRPGNADYPVPPAWDSGDNDLNNYLADVKSDETFSSRFVPWEQQFTDPNYLRTVSLGELGARIEFSIHNQMHMRWCDVPQPGIRPDVDPSNPDAVDTSWDSPMYNWLGDTYSSHVNSVFWKLHGWVDDRISDWASANGVVGEIPWKGTWVGKMPGHSMPHSFLSLMVHRATPLGGHDHHGHLNELIQAIRLVAKQGRFCRFYDEVSWPK